MSFKSKQRAKHGHLFGDDPLNANLVTASDDPLFSPSKTPDPLSRKSSPLDVNHTRRTSKTQSIFGDIDVSKLGGNGVYTGNKPLRSSLRAKQYDGDEDDLFGGGGRTRSRVLSKATSPTSSTTSSTHKTSPSISHTTLPDPVIPTPRPVSTPTAVSAPPNVSTPPTVNTPPIQKPNHNPIIEEKPSFFASASRFFKSSSTSNSKTSSSASSIASVNTEPTRKIATPPPPPPRKEEPVKEPPVKKQPVKEPVKQQLIIEQPTTNKEEEEEETHHVIEDEATRAFADDVISFQSSYQPPDYASDMLASMDSLRLETNKRLLPSASTPTTMRADMDDPWFDTTMRPQLGSLEPSMSSPLQPKVSMQDIEPQKRTAFADLINSWNTGQTIYESEKEDPEQFFSHVAEEQRDIGFAGINDNTIERNVSVIWDNQEENPWN